MGGTLATLACNGRGSGNWLVRCWRSLRVGAVLPSWQDSKIRSLKNKIIENFV